VLQQLEAGHQPAESVKEVPSPKTVPASTRRKRNETELTPQLNLFG
jgi:DNA mismatch repair protein MutS